MDFPSPAPSAPEPEDSPAPERGRSAADHAFEHLRDAIISLALPPGTVLSRAALAQTLGLSQTPLREALIRLQDEHLVATVPQSATRVAPIDVARVREAAFLRLALEAEVVRSLARDGVPDGLRARLREILARQRALLHRSPEEKEEGFALSDGALHATLFEAAGVPGLWSLVRRRSGHLDRLRRLHLPVPGKAESILRDHLRVTEAIDARDVAGAEAAMRAHLSGTLAEIDAILLRHPDYF